MSPIILSVDITAPVESVFARASDVANAPVHIRSIQHVEVLTRGPIGVGTRFRETRVISGHTTVGEMEFSVFEPHARYVVECRSNGMHFRSLFAFESRATGTRLTIHFEARPVTLSARMMLPLMAGILRKCIEDDLADLKASLEGGC